jgi:hypothetical protein
MALEKFRAPVFPSPPPAVDLATKGYMQQVVRAMELYFNKLESLTPNQAQSYRADAFYGGTATFSSAVNDLKSYVSMTAATAAPTAATSGTVYVFNRAAGVTVTLPVAAAGLHYRFIVGTTITSNAGIIKGATAVDCFTAYSMVNLFDKDNNVAQSKIFYADGSNDDVFSMDGSTTGGVLGSVIDVFGVATGGQGSATAVWHLYSPLLIADGTLATPFA